MNPNVKPSQRVTLLDRLVPVSQGAATVATGWKSMKEYESMLGFLSVGVLGAAATIDAKLRQATDGAGAGAKDITGKTITQLTKAGTDDNKEVLINLQSEDLDVEGGFSFVQLQVTVGVAASLIAAYLLGMDARYKPTHAASVDEVVG